LPAELRLSLACVVAFGIAFAATPTAVRLALATDFLDRPGGHKAHARPTPYLGGAALLAGFGIPALAFGGGRLSFIVAVAAVLWAIGTRDDRVGVAAPLRALAAVAAGAVLWALHLGWRVTGSDVANLALSAGWTGAIVIAFNLLDNIDGAAGTTAAVVAGAAAALAVLDRDVHLAAVALSLTGACLAFLRYNLASPARIFLGDGGSLPAGAVVAAITMALPERELGGAQLAAAIPLVAVPVLDSTLVVVARTRRHVPIYRGGCDHLTHRMLAHLGSPRRVALALATVQALACLSAIVATRLGTQETVAVGVGYVALASTTIVILESRRIVGDPAGLG